MTALTRLARAPSFPGRTRGQIALVGVVGLATIGITVWLPWHSPWPPPDVSATLYVATHGLVTTLWLAAALMALSRDPDGPLWKILFAYVPASCVWALGYLATPLMYSISDTFGDLAIAVGVHALLAFPSGRLVGRLDRWLVAFVYVSMTSTALLAAMTWGVTYNCDPFCNQNVFFVWKNDALHDAMQALIAVFLPVVGPVVLFTMGRHWWRAGRPARRALMPVIVSLPFAYASYVMGFIGDNLNIAWMDELGNFPVMFAFNAMVPVGLFIGIARSRLGRGRVADLMVELGGGVPLGGLRDVLARALGDPTLQLAYPSPDGDGFVDTAGQPFEVPGPADGRAVARVEHGDEPLALLVHDPVIDAEDPGLVNAVASAARLAIDNERLAAEVRAQLEEVRASRARIAAAADEERRKVERDLHDGAQQRLVALTMRLEQARATAVGSAKLIDEATSELREAIAEVRNLARGLHPPILTEAGLAAAVESLAERTPIPIDIRVPDRRYPPPIEAAAYYVVAEALTNVTRYAGASFASVEASAQDGSLVVTVSDDGRGGADLDSGTGLRGLADRVAAVGGTLDVASPLGAGTRIRASMPLSEPAR
jgi:signal transduction histidine kinase